MRYISIPVKFASAVLMLFFMGCSKSTTTTSLIGNWISSPDFGGNGRSEAVIFTINDQAYLTTGVNDKTRYNDLWQYDADRMYWIQKADFPGAARSSAVAFTANGKGYVGTGYDGNNLLKDFYQYDATSNSWTQISDFPGTGRYDAVAFAINNMGFVCSGYDGNYKNDLWMYDAEADTWTEKASLAGSKRTAAQSFVINNKAYLCSGNNNGSSLQDLWMYDPVSDSWTQKRKIYNYSDSTFDDSYANIPRYNGVTFVMDNKAYLTTGEDGSLNSKTWQYDPVSDLWLEKTGFEGTARTGAVGFNIKNRGFVVTGRSGSMPFDNMMEFHPDQAQINGD